ncbi:hypothetical protein EP47_07760 [Legionella norrlandica]|uniref:Uncharacterized protein n=2 Tax=Legionella norrlandica TaxID=1498499 RepID=A0A0A2SP66_9GAMM|nr:hypothetical protein EP47_07760 [Legionella norrlandica]
MLKKTMLLLCMTSPVLAVTQGSQGSAMSAQLSSQGIGQIISGSSNLLVAGSQLPIAGVKVVGDFLHITLHSVENSTSVTIKVSRNVAGASLLATGQLVQVVATGSSTLVYTSGQIIAFLPNEMGKSLLHSKKLNREFTNERI